MKTVRKIKVLCVMLFLTTFVYAAGDFSNDAFVLVDVSGTMNDSQTNMEAKNVIKEILLGEFDYPKWQSKGWSKNNNDIIPSEAILKQGSHFCIIPFGNMERIHNNSKHIFQSNEDFSLFYDSHFPSSFKDSWTYITLAKAYVGGIAVADNVQKAYVLIYTDGRPESTMAPYNRDDQQLVDELEHAGSNGFKKIGILRKQKGALHYDVEIWEFTSFVRGARIFIVNASDMQYNGSEVQTRVTVQCERHNLIQDSDFKIMSGNIGKEKGQYVVQVEGLGDYSGITGSAVWRITEGNEPQQHIQITAPSGGRNKNSPYEVEKDQEWTLRWTGGAGSVNVYTKEGDKYKTIPQNKRNEYYTLSISGTTAKLSFSESADYKIEVRGTNGSSDAMFLSVKTPILPILLKLLLVIGLIIGGVCAYNKFFRPRPKPEPIDDWKVNNRTRQTDSHASSGNDDW